MTLPLIVAAHLVAIVVGATAGTCWARRQRRHALEAAVLAETERVIEEAYCRIRHPSMRHPSDRDRST